jgi:hypothetical protein
MRRPADIMASCEFIAYRLNAWSDIPLRGRCYIVSSQSLSCASMHSRGLILVFALLVAGAVGLSISEHGVVYLFENGTAEMDKARLLIRVFPYCA